MNADGMTPWRLVRGTLVITVAVFLLAPLAVVVIISFSAAPFLQFMGTAIRLGGARLTYGSIMMLGLAAAIWYMLSRTAFGRVGSRVRLSGRARCP